MSPDEITINIVIAIVTGLITGGISGWIVGLWVDKKIRAREAARQEERWTVPKRLTYAEVFERVDDLLTTIFPYELKTTDTTILVYSFGYGVEGNSKAARLLNFDRLPEFSLNLSQEGVQKFRKMMKITKNRKMLQELEVWLNSIITTPISTIPPEFIEMLLKLREGQGYPRKAREGRRQSTNIYI